MVTAMTDEARFLKAWVRGVKLTNRPHVFGDGTDPDQARTKWDLCPNYERVEEALDTMSSTERILLAAMYSFYNDVHPEFPKEAGQEIFPLACDLS